MTEPVARLHLLDGDEIDADGLLRDPILHAVPLDGKEKTSFL